LIWFDRVGFSQRVVDLLPLLGKRIRRRISYMDPQNPRTPFHLPLLHTLVEERVGVKRFPARFMFMERKPTPSQFRLLGERIPRRTSRMGLQNPRASFHLPLLHTLVEERAGVRRFPFRFMFMGRLQAPSRLGGLTGFDRF
jgi:hypothetical protein